jgi:hypothetical protein
VFGWTNIAPNSVATTSKVKAPVYSFEFKNNLRVFIFFSCYLFQRSVFFSRISLYQSCLSTSLIKPSRYFDTRGSLDEIGRQPGDFDRYYRIQNGPFNPSCIIVDNPVSLILDKSRYCLDISLYVAVGSSRRIRPGLEQKLRNKLYLGCTHKGGRMNLRCSYCQTPFTIGRNEKLIALQTMQTEDLRHYDAHCPRCRRANQVPRNRLELSFPGWEQALAAVTGAPAPKAIVAQSKPAASSVKGKSAKAPAAKAKPAAAKTKPVAAKALPKGKPAAKPAPAAKAKPAAKPAKAPAAKAKPAAANPKPVAAKALPKGKPAAKSAPAAKAKPSTKSAASPAKGKPAKAPAAKPVPAAKAKPATTKAKAPAAKKPAPAKKK